MKYLPTLYGWWMYGCGFVDGWAIFRLTAGLFLFGSGCFLAYRAKLGRYSTEFPSLFLILLGLICGLWDSLWL